MASTAELVKRLEGDGEPLAKRLRLAQNVFQSSQIPVQRKEEAIVTWLCKMAGKTRKKNKRESGSKLFEDNVQIVWSTLRNCIASQHMQRLGVADIRPSVKSNIVTVLSKHLERNNLDKVEIISLLECALSVLEASSFQRYFRTNIQLCMDFAKVVLSSSAELGVDHVQLCIRSASSIQAISRQTILRNELCKAFLNTSLLPLMKLLQVHGYQPSPLTAEIYKCIQQVLFPKASSDFSQFFSELFKERKNIVDPTVDLPCSDNRHPVPVCLFRALKESKDLLDNDAYISLFSTVFRAYVATHKTNSRPMVFPMAVVMLYLVGFDLNRPKLCTVPYRKLRESLSKAEEKPSHVSLGVLQGITLILSQWGVSLNEEICSSNFLSWLQLLVESLFPIHDGGYAGVSLMELMCTLIKLNPMIVEPHVKDILLAVSRKSLSDEEKPIYTTLISGILSMYMKLSRVPNFVSVFLTSLFDGLKKQHMSDSLLQGDEVWLPPTFMENFTKYATIIPSMPCVATLKVLLEWLSKNCLEVYESFIQGQLTESNSAFLDMQFKCVSELLCAFLKGVRLIEQCQTQQARQGYCLFLEQLREQLRRFGQILSKKSCPEPSLISSFLNIAYHWASEAMLIEQYADIGREELLAAVGTNLSSESQTSNDDGSLSYLHPYLRNSEWVDLRKKLLQCGGKNSEELMLKLDLQLLAALCMFKSGVSMAMQEVANQACSQVAQKLSIMPRSLINQSTVSNIRLMTPLLKESELRDLCGGLISCLLDCKENELSSDIISTLVEDRSVACGLVCSTLSSLKHSLQVSKRKKNELGGKQWKTSRAVLGKLDSEVIMNVEAGGLSGSCDQIKAIVSSMTPIVEKAIVLLSDGHVNNTGEAIDLTNVSQHLHFLRTLPLAYLSSGSQSVIFISMLSLALDCLYLPSSLENDGNLKGIFDHILLGLYERGARLGPSLEGCIDQGALADCLAYVVINHNVGRHLLKLVLSKALHEEKAQDQVLAKVPFFRKSMKERGAPSKENLLLATLLLEDLSGKRLRTARTMKSSMDLDESSSNPENRLKKTRRKLASSFEALIHSELVNSEDCLQAFALTLDFNLKFDKGVVKLAPHLDKFCQSAVSFLAGRGSAQKNAAETFIIAILRHINKLTESIPTFFIKEVWSHLVSSVYLNETLLIAVYESASQEEMQFIVNDLLHHTRKVYTDGTPENEAFAKSSLNITHFWQVLLRCQNLPAANNETCWRAIRSVLEHPPSTKKLPPKQLFEVLKAILSTSKVPMDMEMVDLCLSLLSEVSLPSAVKEFTPAAEQYLSVLSALLLHRTSLALDCIPSLMQKLLHLVRLLANGSKQRPELSRADGAQLASLAFGVEKLVYALTKPDIRKSFKRVAAYFTADIILIFETVTLCASVKVHFQNMVFALLSIVDEYSVKFLLRTMSSASTEVFKPLYDSYKKHHRFSGKV